MSNNEKDILNIIKYFPSIFILLISSILTLYLYNQNKQELAYQTQKLEEKYIELNRAEIKYQVERVKDRILFEETFAMASLKDELKNQINTAYEILNSIYEKNQNESKEVIFYKIKDVLEHISFNDERGYIFMYTLDGTTILHPKKKYLEGKNLWNSKDEKGVYYIQEMNKILNEKDETFYSWYWKKDDNKKLSYKKIGFFKKFEPLGIFIGAGEYIDDFKTELKYKILKNISDFRYKENGYIFIISFEGEYLAYFDEEYLGKTVFEKSFNYNIRKTFKNMVEAAKKGDYISYYHSGKPDGNVSENIYKFSYVDSIKDWDWIIGTGFYMDDFYKNIQSQKEELTKISNSRIQKILISSFVMTLFVLVIFLNLSKILEEKFRKYKEDIEKQINDNIKKDNILAHQSKMAAMGEMIGNIAHQWRQPLSTISTVVTGIKMKKEFGMSDEKDEVESLDMVNKHVQYLSQTIDDFRDFFKPQKDPRKFNISSTLEKALGLVTVQFKSKDIEIVKNIEDSHLNSLENELIQVLINILNNSRDELIKVEHRRLIFIETFSYENSVDIIIKDNAGGIPQDIINNIFDAYFTTKGTLDGTGIGLFMSEEIISKHLKGSVMVSNDTFKYDDVEYKGAIFKLTLPLNIEINNSSKEDLS